MPFRLLAAAPIVSVLSLAACASASPFDDIAAFQQRLDRSGMGFGLTRVPGHDAMVFQIRFSGAAADDPSAPEPDIAAAAAAAAPSGCSVAAIAPQPDGVSYRVDYTC
jgi:hypothetical protein